MKRYAISILFLTALFKTFFVYSKDLIHDYADFDPYQKTFTKAEVEEKLSAALIKDKEVYDHLDISDHAISIYDSLENKKLNQPEFTLYFGENEKCKTENKCRPIFKKPLQGLRVAIDPGHFGADLSKVEERYIYMEPSPENGLEKEASFNEGTLTVITAKRLADKLKKLGAEVFITKDEPGKAVLSKSFSSWYNEDFENVLTKLTANLDQQAAHEQKVWWRTKASSSQVFRSLYNFIDIEKRAELINEFKPDVTIACHYNLGGVYDSNGKNPGTHDDYTQFFVPGAFVRGHHRDEPIRKSSLKQPDSRYEFVRLLVTDTIEESCRLAVIAQDHAKKVLELPPGDHPSYLPVLCLKYSSGIYHRNLMLCRLVHSPIIYCEPFCQDNFKQVKILAENPDLRINQVVDIHVATLLDWVVSKNQKLIETLN